MSNVAVLGLGAMGFRMAENLLKAGNKVTVWNRSPGPALKLASDGARSAASPREAAESNDFVLSMVRDDDASREVWLDETDGALQGMKPGAIAIESSTLTPDWILRLDEAMRQAGIALLEAPVSGSTPQAQDATLIFLAGGEEETLRAALPILKSLGSSVQHTGPLGTGSLAKLVTNTLMGVQITALAEMIGMLRKHGVDAGRVLKAVGSTTIWSPHLTRDAESMLSNDFEARFPVSLLEKDLGYTIGTAGGDSSAPTVAAVRHVFQKAVTEGLGNENMTAVVKLFESL